TRDDPPSPWPPSRREGGKLDPCRFSRACPRKTTLKKFPAPGGGVRGGAKQMHCLRMDDFGKTLPGRGLSLGLRPGLTYNRQNFTPLIKVIMSGTAPTVQFFITCLLDSLFPAVAQDVVTVLQRQGVKVEVPAGQTCCGQPMFNGGFWPEARSAAA